MNVPKINITIPEPPLALRKSSPVRLVKPSFRYSKPGEFGKAGSPSTERQGWFRAQLTSLSSAVGSLVIPFAFDDNSGKQYRLDCGAVKFAVNSGFIRPLEADATGVVREVVLARGAA
jgi:hypothetical protein